MTPEQWKAIVGDPIRDRRRQLGIKSMRKAAAGAEISESVWRQVETGRRQLSPGHWVAPNPNEETRVAICRRLFWSDDSIDRLLAGEPPNALDAAKIPTDAEGRLDSAAIDGWVDATAEELDFLMSEAGFEARAEVVNFARRVLESEFYRTMSANPLEQPGLEEGDSVTYRMIKYRTGTHPALSPAPPNADADSGHAAVDAYRQALLEQTDENFVQAAEGGPTEEAGERVHRPEPDPEPEGS